MDSAADSDEDQEGILDLERCIKQLVRNAAKNAKSLSNRKKTDQFIAKTALERSEIAKEVIN